jgi:glycosyltransferase involved in cell wall biosynthesis
MLKVVIPSRTIANLNQCVEAALHCEPDITPADIIVIDDDESGQIETYCESMGLDRIQGIKPFIFSRNTNLGLERAFEQSDEAVLLNDDALLRTHGGFSALQTESRRFPLYGILAAVTNVVGNLNQMPQGTGGIRREYRQLCFVCVLITKRCWDQVGPLDESYAVDYGVEDGDYSYRVRLAGLRLGIYDKCYVDHSQLPSSYRGYGARSFQGNAEVFEKKWGFSYSSL